ncbi:uncharacterized protein LOC127837794 [Dreissena polymorpha]|uniref:uncharacterized protein LOC127837794 n=1 Tax=Dreissena polymorpha TaxID=45954 RepID=UPI0022643977|nr:uncharacterized protein LOC127837794 [Dreissena polymorpha]
MAEGGIIRDAPGGIPSQCSVSSSHGLLHFELFSEETCTLMNILGYGPHIRKARSDAYMAYGRNITMQTCSTCFTTGSKAEGLTRIMESDLDLMCVPTKHDICLEEGVDSSNVPWEKNIFRSCSRLSYPGHCRLFLERYGIIMSHFLYNALCDDGHGRIFLSSDLYVSSGLNIVDPRGVVVSHGRAGPSVPMSHGGIEQDLVCALQYDCPSILTRWAARPRSWPSPDVVKEVVSLGAFLAPVGVKGSDYECVEWRICFNTGENVLIHNLNDTQGKLYVLLKMVKKDVLKPQKKEVTSFTMKNIVLWIAENNPQSLFHERSLFHWLHEGLHALRVALATQELPYFMIPERNLIGARALEQEQKLSWIATIDEMMEEGPRIILRLPKIRQALIAHPEPLRWYSGRKIEMEILELIHRNRLALGMDEGTDFIMQAVRRREKEIVKEVRMRMILEGCRVNNLLNVFDWMLM